MTNLPRTFVVGQDSSGVLVEDGYSSRARPRVGYHDFLRTVIFWNKSSSWIEEYTSKMFTELKADRLNMWSSMRKVSTSDFETKFEFSFGYDSGD